MSFRHLLLLFLFLLFLHALAFIFSVTRSFSLPEFSFFHSARRRGAWVVLRSGLAALCLVSQLSVRSRGALLRRLGLRRCACDSKCYPGGLALPNPRPSSLRLSRCTGRFNIPVIGLAPRGENGMVASVEETDSSAGSTSSGRLSAVLTIVGPPRVLLAKGPLVGGSFSGPERKHCSWSPPQEEHLQDSKQ